MFVQIREDLRLFINMSGCRRALNGSSGETIEDVMELCMICEYHAELLVIVE